MQINISTMFQISTIIVSERNIGGVKVNEWLKAYRDNKGFTQEQISHLAGISRSHYTNIENDERCPGIITAKKIADALGFDWTRFYKEKISNENSTGLFTEKGAGKNE